MYINTRSINMNLEIGSQTYHYGYKEYVTIIKVLPYQYEARRSNNKIFVDYKHMFSHYKTQK